VRNVFEKLSNYQLLKKCSASKSYFQFLVTFEKFTEREFLRISANLTEK
jgi:hypothetical protein